MDTGIRKDWKEAVLSKFGVLSRHLPGETEEKDENSVRIADPGQRVEPRFSRIRST
jgi:hypothetical protein